MGAFYLLHRFLLCISLNPWHFPSWSAAGAFLAATALTAERCWHLVAKGWRCCSTAPGARGRSTERAAAVQRRGSPGIKLLTEYNSVARPFLRIHRCVTCWKLCFILNRLHVVVLAGGKYYFGMDAKETARGSPVWRGDPGGWLGHRGRRKGVFFPFF